MYNVYMMDKLVANYIKQNIDNLISVEGLVIYLIENGKTYEQAKELSGKYKGLINMYAKRWLKEKIGSGARNSLTYLQLLKDIKEDEPIGADDKIIVNIDLNNTSKNTIKEDE